MGCARLVASRPIYQAKDFKDKQGQGAFVPVNKKRPEHRLEQGSIFFFIHNYLICIKLRYHFGLRK